MTELASTATRNRMLAVIKEFQCPGCALGGPDPEDCTSHKLEHFPHGNGSFRCGTHAAGTNMGFGPPTLTRIALGLPVGFNKVGATEEDSMLKRLTNIRLHFEMPTKLWNRFNLPIWAMFKDGAVFVRTYSPRVNLGFVDVIKNASLSQKDVDLLMELHGTIDVGTFVDEID